ncbi:plasmid mobilization relaxosome protein MobC [Mucilaginibacter sp.]|uniref:plasmid mobilization protein n=1 Tax=Mucilaginibacter sp. TaxID=1882438 RepID=UPI0025E87D25|nr:plasmid mobilization relaxosome protein MobC [Mucilaginibacter sp.]
MPRRKADKPEELLTHNLIVRVTETLFNKLETLCKESGCLSIAEVCRKILSNQKIKIFKEDISMNPVMEELALIRKELKAIGVNINQITRSFNQDRARTHHTYHVLKVAEQYERVDERVEILLAIIAKLADKWLQK